MASINVKLERLRNEVRKEISRPYLIFLKKNVETDLLALVANHLASKEQNLSGERRKLVECLRAELFLAEKDDRIKGALCVLYYPTTSKEGIKEARAFLYTLYKQMLKEIRKEKSTVREESIFPEYRPSNNTNNSEWRKIQPLIEEYGFNPLEFDPPARD
jgi:hypothetical protein